MDACTVATTYAIRISKSDTLEDLRAVWMEINTNIKTVKGWYEWLTDLKDSKKWCLEHEDDPLPKMKK